MNRPLREGVPKLHDRERDHTMPNNVMNRIKLFGEQEKIEGTGYRRKIIPYLSSELKGKYMDYVGGR